MSRQKLRVANTDAHNLVSNLRGEVGEIVTSWVIMRHFIAEGGRLASGDPGKDLRNRKLSFVNLLADKLRDELVARLSEIAEDKVGRLNFYFAARKLGRFRDEASAFSEFIVRNRLRERRNRDVSHKELPETLSDHRDVHIPYRVLVRAIAWVLWLMKRIDRHTLGPSAPYAWREARKRRYEFISPPRAGYMLLPYLHLSGEDRIRILREELEEGTQMWSEVHTTVNRQRATVLACKKWGIIVLGDRVLALEHYPLQELANIEIASGSPEATPPGQ